MNGSQAKKQADAPGVGQMETFFFVFCFCFSVSLGDLAEPKGFRYQQDTSLNPDGSHQRKTVVNMGKQNCQESIETHTLGEGSERERNQR